MGGESEVRTGRLLRQGGSKQPPASDGPLLGKASNSRVSATFDVKSQSVVLRLYSATPDDVVEVQAVDGVGSAEYVAPLVIDGQPVVLTQAHNEVSISRTGRYRVELKTGSLGLLAVFKTQNEVSR